MSLQVVRVATKPFLDQIPGTSGLRKLAKVYQQEHYIENFAQSILLTVGSQLQGCSLLVGGDGRFLCKEAAVKIVRICAGNGVSKVFVGQYGWFSSPAAAHFIEKYSLAGAIILTASHNPGGPNADFGIKFNGSNGGPIPPAVTAELAENAKNIAHYSIVPNLIFDMENIGTQVYDISGKSFTVQVVDFVDDYIVMAKEIFDFNAIRNLLKGVGRPEKFRICLDAMNAITGPYLERIFVQELGAPPDCLQNTKPMVDFGGKPPDPNLTYARDLVEFMETHHEYGFAAAFDGDGDRNMIMGQKGLFITPSDSLAILADNLQYIPYFKERKINGFGRSMPTSSAVDRVAQAKNIPLHVTPTGWKYFVDLISHQQISICGEESFGTGSCHIKEKDGIWAALAWLSIIDAKKMSVEEILLSHWNKYGRHFYMRYDYENCDSDSSKQMIAEMEKKIQKKSFIGNCMACESSKHFLVQSAEKFTYTSPLDGKSFSDGYTVFFTNGSRATVRLSGTGSTGATIRVYFEGFEENPQTFSKSPKEVLDILVGGFINFLRVKEFTGRDKPTVIT